MKKPILVFIVVIFLLFVLYLTLNAFLNSGARTISAEKVEYVMTADDILNEFTIDSQKSTTKYLNKVIEISGTVTSSNNKFVILNGKACCQLKKEIDIKVNSKVKIKGRVTGFDDLLEEVKLDECSIVN